MTRAGRSAAIVAATAAALLALASAREGTRQLAARDARDALVAAAGGRDSDAISARARLERALSGAPGDADLLELRARWALRDMALAGDARAAQRAAAAAARDFRASLAQRPHWPYAWSGLATALAAGGDARALRTAIDAALRHGVNERRVNAELADLWLTHADAFPALDRAWRRALADAPSHWIDRADRAGRGLTACSGDTLPAIARERCVALGWLTERASRG
jgi:hypothetical protein